MTDLLVKFPSRARPQLFAATFARWNAVPEACRFLCTLDSDDPSLPAYRDILYGRENVRITVGESFGKVHACERDLAAESWTGIVCLASDDQVPQRPDWAARVRELFAEHFPDGDGVLHLNDGRRGRGLNTLCIVDRTYFDRTDYLYRCDHDYPGSGYVSTHCDDEFQDVSERLGRAVYVDEIVFKHCWIGDTPDTLHLRNEAQFQRDAKVHAARRANGYPR